MNAISLRHRKSMEPEVKHRVNFYIEDADKRDFPANFYDVVYRSLQFMCIICSYP